jgi:predicted nucleotidyltransferase
MAYDTSVLDKAIAKRHARWEQERQATLARVLQLLDEYGPRFDLREAYVFGSVVGPGRFDALSDVDIAVGRMPVAGFFQMMATLSLELGRDVDLVELDKCHFARRIREEGIRWTRQD